MKKLFSYFLLAFLIVSCSSNDETPILSETLSIKPYSCDVTKNGIVVVYKTTGIARFEAMYREQFTDDWHPAETKASEAADTLTVSLKELTLRHYYQLLVTVYNDKGESVTDNFIVQYDYDAQSTTYFAQPFLQWGALVSGVKTAMADNGNILEEETETETETRLTYRFLYKELKSEYLFDEEKQLREVLIYFDKNRVGMEELRRYIGLAFSYLAFGNIHINMDGTDKAYTLFKTAEGTSYVVLYERGEQLVVNYMSASSIDVNETLYK